jgi:hypothetical protein
MVVDLAKGIDRFVSVATPDEVEVNRRCQGRKKEPYRRGRWRGRRTRRTR